MSSNQVVEITETEFWEQFRPVKNHLVNNASFDDCMFETYGKEVDYVHAKNLSNPLHVWTIMDCDGKLVIGKGYHHVNRMGYLITENPALPNTEYIIQDEEDVLDQPEEVSSVSMQDIVGDYDTPDEVPEWKWIEANASFKNTKNGNLGVWEFMMNMNLSYDDIPEKLKGVFQEAQARGISYLIFHQGT